MGATVAFPFKPGDDVETKDHSGVSFAVKVFTVIHRYGGPDFAVVVDAKGRTHHKHFDEIAKPVQ
jgi:hypothetical protein